MAEAVPIVLTIVLVIVAIVLAVVGVQVVLVLNEVRKTLKRVNDTLDNAEQRLNAVMLPLQNLGGMTKGISTGLKVFETFVSWLNRKDK